jgi:DNA-binding response OmpR family regulator
MLLLQNASVPKARIDMATRCVDVHICHIRRRFLPFRIVIATLWGYGYQLSADSRHRVMELILDHKGVPA